MRLRRASRPDGIRRNGGHGHAESERAEGPRRRSARNAGRGHGRARREEGEPARRERLGRGDRGHRPRSWWTRSPSRRRRSPRGAGQPEEREVIEIELADKPGALAEAAAKLGRAGVNITHVFVGTGLARKATVFLGVSDRSRRRRRCGRARRSLDDRPPLGRLRASGPRARGAARPSTGLGRAVFGPARPPPLDRRGDERASPEGVPRRAYQPMPTCIANSSGYRLLVEEVPVT